MALETRLRTTGGLGGGGVASPLGVTAGGTGTATQFTAGSVVFAGASGVYAQKNANFFWDNTNNRLGIGTSSPLRTVDMRGASNFSFMEATGANGLIITPDGSVNGEMAYGVRLQTGSDGENINIIADSSTGGTSSSTRIIYYNGAAFYAALQISNVAGGGTTRGNLLLMQSGGNVGIGITSPGSLLDIGSTSTAAQTFQQIRYTAATIVAGAQTGLLLDMTTFVTPGAQNIIGLNIKTAGAFVSNTTQGAILINNTGGGNSVTIVNTSDSQGMYFANNFTSAITSSMFIQQRTGTISGGGTESRSMILCDWAPTVSANLTYLPSSAMVNVLFDPVVSAGVLTVTGAVISQVNYAPTTSGGGSVSGLVVGFKVAVTPPNASASRGIDVVMGANSSGACINVTGNGTGPLFLGVDTSTTVYTLYDGGGLELGAGTTTPGKSRFKVSGGTATATTDWSASAEWGASATVSAVTGNDSRGTVTVTTNAADTPTAGPTVTLTFKDGTWTTAPFAVSCMVSSSTGPTTIPVSITTSATTLVVKYNGTPTATSALTYIFSYHVLG